MIRLAPATLALLATLPLSACLDRAEVERTLGPESQDLVYPGLLPMDELLSIDAGTPQGNSALIRELRARAKALRRDGRPTKADAELAAELDARAEELLTRAEALGEIEPTADPDPEAPSDTALDATPEG